MSFDHATQRRLLRLAARYATRHDQEYTIDTFIDLLSDIDAAHPALGTSDRRAEIDELLAETDRFLALLHQDARAAA